jgi:carboxymethylproline synthase
MKGGQEVDDWIDGIIDMYKTPLKMSKPVVGAIDGHAIGIGFQLAMTFDWRVAGKESSFALPELKHGLACTLGAAMLQRFTGYAAMKEIIMDGEPIAIEEAKSYGLVNQVAQSENLLEEAVSIARKFSTYPNVAFSKTKKVANQKFLEDLDQVADLTKEAHRESFKAKAAQPHFKNILGSKYTGNTSLIKSYKPVHGRFGILLDGSEYGKLPAFDKSFSRGLYENGFILMRGFGTSENQAIEWFKTIGSPISYSFGNVLKMTPKAGTKESQFTHLHMAIHQDTILNASEKATMLSFYCAEAPEKEKGGETLLTDNRRFLEILPKDLLGILRKHKVAYKANTPGYYKGEGSVLQSPITLHPITGEEVLFMGIDDPSDPNRNYISAFDGMSPHESRDVMTELDKYQRHPDVLYPHKWKVGDMLMLDNFFVSHGRNAFEPGQSRRLMRVSTVLPKDRSLYIEEQERSSSVHSTAKIDLSGTQKRHFSTCSPSLELDAEQNQLRALDKLEMFKVEKHRMDRMLDQIQERQQAIQGRNFASRFERDNTTTRFDTHLPHREALRPALPTHAESVAQRALSLVKFLK